MSPSLNAQITAGALAFAFQGRPDHVKRYLARVDLHLTCIPDGAARREFLDREIANWQARYAQFTRKVDSGRDTSPEVQAFDFLDTLGELDMRLARLNRQQPAE